jgi:hypothetical protein
MSNKRHTPGNRQDRRAKVPCCQHTIVPPFAPPPDWPAAAVLATQTLQKPDFIASHATGQRRTEGVGRARPEEDGPFPG